MKRNKASICNRPISECNDCSLRTKLKCRFKVRDLIIYMIPIMIIFIPAIIGMLLSKLYVSLIGYTLFLLVFFTYETRILCSHCPYYNEEKKCLHCYIHYGLIKIWKYHPEPMKRSEKIIWIITFAIMMLFPLPFLIIGQQYLMFTISMIGLTIWIIMEITYMSKKCVNFSCPLNRVPKNIKDEFLKRNPVMQKAWEEKGYNVD